MSDSWRDEDLATILAEAGQRQVDLAFRLIGIEGRFNRRRPACQIEATIELTLGVLLAIFPPKRRPLRCVPV